MTRLQQLVTSALAHELASASVSTSRADHHARQPSLLGLRLHLTVVLQHCSSAPAAARRAASSALRCCSSSKSTLTVGISTLPRLQVAQDEAAAPPAKAPAPAADGRHRLVRIVGTHGWQPARRTAHCGSVRRSAGGLRSAPDRSCRRWPQATIAFGVGRLPAATMGRIGDALKACDDQPT